MTQQYTGPESRMVRDPLSENPATSERSMTDIVAELWENSEKLVRKEFELAVTELDRKVDEVKKDLTVSAMGGAVMYGGVLTLIAALVLVLSLVIAPWLAALIVGAAVSLGGWAMLQKGKKDLEHEDLRMRQTERSLQRTAHSLKEAVK